MAQAMHGKPPVHRARMEGYRNAPRFPSIYAAPARLQNPSWTPSFSLFPATLKHSPPLPQFTCSHTSITVADVT